MKRLLNLGIAVTAISALACHREPTAPAPGYHAFLQSEFTSYTAARVGTGAVAYSAFTVAVRYVNQGVVPIYIERCGGSSQPLAGVQPVTNDGVPVGSADLPPFDCSSSDSAFVVQPGSVRRDTLTLAAPAVLPANVRLFYLAHTHCDFTGGGCTPLLPESARVSSTIQVLPAP